VDDGSGTAPTSSQNALSGLWRCLVVAARFTFCRGNNRQRLLLAVGRRDLPPAPTASGAAIVATGTELSSLASRG